MATRRSTRCSPARMSTGSASSPSGPDASRFVWAVIGAGGVAQSKWLPAVRRLQTLWDPVELVGIADPAEAQGRKSNACTAAAGSRTTAGSWPTPAPSGPDRQPRRVPRPACSGRARARGSRLSWRSRFAPRWSKRRRFAGWPGKRHRAHGRGQSPLCPSVSPRPSVARRSRGVPISRVDAGQDAPRLRLRGPFGGRYGPSVRPRPFLHGRRDRP